MHYDNELFQGRKERDSATRYRYFYLGAYYDCYSDDGKEFYLSKSDQASFLERVRIYRNQVLREKSYPILDSRNQIRPLLPISPVVLQQFLGLPLEIYEGFKGASGEKLLDLVLSRVHFDENIRKGYLPLAGDNVERQIVEDDDLCLDCIHHLLGKGIYLPHLETLVPTAPNFSEWLPAYCDEKRVPEGFKKASSSLLLMCFGDWAIFKPLADLEMFRRFVDSMSLEAQFHFAYSAPSQGAMEMAVQEMLRQYFNGLIRRELNLFFAEVYHLSEAFPRSILDEEVDFLPYAHHTFAIGRNFVMTAKSTLYEEEKDGVISFVERKDRYCFCEKDKEALRFAFEKVQDYLRKSKWTIYPELFLRLMGVPYPCLEAVRSFSFEQGDSASFLNLLSFDDFDIFDYDLPCFDIGEDKTIVLRKGKDLPFLRYLLVREGVFPLFLNETIDHFNYCLFLDEKARSFLPESFLGEGKDLLPKVEEEMGDLFRWPTHFVTGFSRLYENAIARLLKGEESSMAFASCKGDDLPFPNQCPAFRGLLLILHVLARRIPAVHKKAASKKSVLLFDQAPREEIVFLDGSRFFLTELLFFASRKDEIVFLAEDIPPLQKLQEVFDRFPSAYQETLNFHGRYVLQSPGFSPRENVHRFTGLPRPYLRLSCKTGFSFLEGFSFFENPKYQEAISSSPILSRMKARREALKDGILIQGEGTGMSSVLALPVLNYDIALFVKMDLYSLVLSDLMYNVWKFDPFHPNYDEDDPEELEVLRSQMNSVLNSSIYRTRLARVTGKETSECTGYRYDPKIGHHVAYGLIFNVYSKTGNPGTFFLEEGERESFENFWKIVRCRFFHKSTTRKKDRSSASFLFLLPLPLAESFLKTGSFRYPFGTLERKDESKTFESYFRIQNTLSNPFDSSLFLRELLKDGILFYDHEDLVDRKRSLFLSIRNDPEAIVSLFDRLFVFALPKLSGLAQELFFPNPQTYIALLDRFEKEYYERVPQDGEFSLYRAMLEEAYRKDPKFLYDIFLVDDFQLVKVLERNGALFGNRFSQKKIRRFTDFQLLFEYFVLTEYFNRIWQRILSRDMDLLKTDGH